MKRLTRMAAALLMSLVLLSGVVSLNTGRASAATCDPDIANPLKCFCEEVNRTGIDNQSDETKKICNINDAENVSGSEKGLLAKNGIVKKILNLLSWITGFLAAVYVIVGGFKVITSGGDSDSVASGRKMILYALVGIAVVISSNLIINLVIGAVNNASK